MSDIDSDPRFVKQIVQLPRWFAPTREVCLLVGGKPECLQFDHPRLDSEVRVAILNLAGEKSVEVIPREQYERERKAQEAKARPPEPDWSALTADEQWPVLNELRELARVGCVGHHPYAKAVHAALRKLGEIQGKN